MTLTTQQQQFVKELVWKKVKYEETFEEVYDHILTALEEREESNLPFDLLVFKIINENFGGFKAIRDSEKRRLRIVSTQMGDRYKQGMSSMLKPPGVLIILALYSLVVYLLIGCKGYIARDMVPMVLTLIPIAMINVRHLSRIYNGKKRSIVSMVVNIHAFSIFPIAVGKLITKPKMDLRIMDLPLAAIGGFFVTMCMLFMLSFVWIYYAEFKMKMVS